MNKDTVYLILLSAIFFIWGLSGIIRGVTEVGGGRRGWGKPVVVYRGRALGVLMVIESVVVAVIYALVAIVPARLTYAKAMNYLLISLGIGFVVGVAMCVFNTIMVPAPAVGVRYEADKVPKGHPVSLHEAASCLKMSEADLLQMAQNHGIESRQVNGQYLF